MTYHVHYHSKSGYPFNTGIVANNVAEVHQALFNESIKWIREYNAVGKVVWKAPGVQMRQHHIGEGIKAGRSLVVQRQ